MNRVLPLLLLPRRQRKNEDKNQPFLPKATFSAEKTKIIFLPSKILASNSPLQLPEMTLPSSWPELAHAMHLWLQIFLPSDLVIHFLIFSSISPLPLMPFITCYHFDFSHSWMKILSPAILSSDIQTNKKPKVTTSDQD